MIYIIRHGETKYNVEKRYAGRIDVPLNENGIIQAKETREKLKNIKFDIVISSPLQRALETAKIITKEPILKDERIIERDNGDLQGKLIKNITEIIDFNDPHEMRYNIENIIDFRKRIKDFALELQEKYHGKNVLVVTHAGVGIYLKVFFEGEPKNGDYSKYKLKNCEVLEYNND